MLKANKSTRGWYDLRDDAGNLEGETRIPVLGVPTTGSANRKKSAAKLARLHYRIACQRSDFLHKLTTRIVREHSAIGVESLNISGMIRNRCLARGIADAGWSELLRQLQYKAAWSGATIVEADRFYPSTKTCSECGRVKDSMPLSERVYRCECGLEMDRDVNAARNLLSLCTVSSTESKACGDGSLDLLLKQEPSTATCGSISENGPRRQSKPAKEADLARQLADVRREREDATA